MPLTQSFEERLLDELLARIDDRQNIPAARKRRLQGGLAHGVGAIGAIAVAALLVAALLPADPERPTAATRGATDLLAPAPAAAAEVRSRARRALAASKDVVLYAEQRTWTIVEGRQAVVRTETWTDEQHAGDLRIRTYADDGSLVLDSAFRATSSTLGERQIDYRAGTWSETHTARRAAVRHAVSKGEARRLRAALATGDLRLVRERELHGHRALLLIDQEPGIDRKIWVDPATWLPIRRESSYEGGREVTDYRWLPRTAENVRALWPDVPAGLRRVDASTDDPGKSR